jgi:anti-sigma regulatory factor (Ser/Thr protein kinase)
MFRSILDRLARHRDDRTRVRLVAERPWSFEDDVQVRAYMRYEAASNLAYPRFDASVLCPYDLNSTPDEVVRAVRRTHPEVHAGGDRRPSGSYEDPRRFVAAWVAPPEVPADATRHPLDALEDVARGRHAVRADALRAGLDRAAADDLATAASEVAANAFVHGAGPRSLTTYVDDGHLVCRVSDAGDGLADPLVGYLPPDPLVPGGRGLWLAHQLCDVAEVASGAAGTDVVLYMNRPVAA